MKNLTSEIRLLPSDAEYADCFWDWRQDHETVRYNPLAPSSVEAIKKRLASSASDLSLFANHDAFLWFVEFEKELAGQVSLQNINRMMLTAEIGYTIAPAARGKGVATAAVCLLSQNAFAQTSLRKLIAYVHNGNEASKKVLEKVGFKQEGLLREHYLINGKPADEAVYGLLRGEFFLR